MKIAASTVLLSASHAYQELQQQRESLTVWRAGGERVQISAASERRVTGSSASLALWSQAPAASPPALPAQAAQPATADPAAAAPTGDSAPNTDPNMQALIQLVERLTGKKVRLFNPNALGAAQRGTSHGEEAAADRAGSGWGAVYERHDNYSEAEQTTFTAQAVVKTGDGRQLDITLALNMSREFASSNDIVVRAGAALKDPLVLNFNGTAAQLTATAFSFDIDSDGQAEQIAFVTPDSGFLALDRNGDGSINNGSELFGAASGNGFAELAAYDQDGNHWIDESDPIWSQLRIWSKDASGTDQLATLGEHGVGALYLGSTSTPFQLKDGSNNLRGAVRASGIYLQENGVAGTLQQLDLVV